ncbi:MAG: sugar phosphate isomerase/epimerase, partial [Acidobacteriota bacterium]|nr:sugar phosphate isomerase/epimerase [Acidobacteriota bacterium]
MALAALPVAGLAQPPQGGRGGFGGGRGTPPPPPKSNFNGVQIGVITYSFRQGVAAKDLIPVMNKLGITEVELMSNHCEELAGAPAGPAFGFGGGRGRGQVTPEQQAAMQKARDEQAKWRASTTVDTWKGVRKQFDDAGIDLKLLCYNLNINMKDDEIDYSFRMAQALGVSAISCSTTVSMAKRVAPFADKYKIMWGGHGHDNVADPEQFAKPETFEKIMSFSPYIGVNLDIGHFYAAGYEPVEFIKQHHARITNLHLKDRNRDWNMAGGRGGANLRWGDGQTPIRDVLLLLRKEKYPFPANIEYEYQGTDPVMEVAKCLEYCRDILIS